VKEREWGIQLQQCRERERGEKRREERVLFNCLFNMWRVVQSFMPQVREVWVRMNNGTKLCIALHPYLLQILFKEIFLIEKGKKETI